MTTFVVLVTLSMLIILGTLYRYFGKQVESEFFKKLLAQKGQVEIILKSRITGIEAKLRDLASDNIVRVTLMLGARNQLEERVTQTYPLKDGVCYFVKRVGEKSIVPETYRNLPKPLVDYVLSEGPRGEILQEGGLINLLWLFSTPIMHQTRRMGTAYAFYDMAQDHNLTASIHRKVDGDISIIKSDRLLNLSTGISWPLDADLQKRITVEHEFHPLGKNLVISKIGGFENLYFQSSLQSLLNEKRNITLWMGLLSAVILAVSTLASVFLGNNMVAPLREMTRKAIQISEGQKNLLFRKSSKNYWEFNQLSQAFNYMLKNLKNAEEQSRYRELLENVDDAVYILDEKANILEANEAAYSQLGYTREVFFGLNLNNLIPRNDAQRITDQLKKDNQSRERKKITVETSHLKKDGDRIPVEIQSRAISYRGRNVILNVARDVSKRIEAEEEKKRLEAQLTHAQKMEAIGTLAGGVAHDFNNLLMGIQGYISLMRLDTDLDQPHAKYLQGIEENVMSAANLTDQLLGFARKGKYSPRPSNLNDIIDKSCRMFTRTRKEISVHKKHAENIWKVEADRAQVEQVLINLYLNAWHAMPEGGDLFIQTENVILSDEYCEPHELSGGKYVKIAVTDTGIGMDRKTMDRIFEPFFTTKEVGKGTGLGLASAYGIIKNHNGFIKVYSERGHGTTFNIYLPASEAEPYQIPESQHELVKGNESILLVDDEEGPLLVEELLLKELGYTVLTAKSGEEAIDLYKKNMDHLDLVALDMIMPEMSGKETFEQLKMINPDVKVLIVSGYSLNKQIEELIASGCDDYIQKPFDIIKISLKLREVLDGDQHAEKKAEANRLRG